MWDSDGKCPGSAGAVSRVRTVKDLALARIGRGAAVAAILASVSVCLAPIPGAAVGPRVEKSPRLWSPDGPDALEECTIGVISPRASRDGRPLLWKNRDSGYLDNEAVFFVGEKYDYITLVNAGQTADAWVGVNEAGFAVLNALSYNIPDSIWGGITNGRLMKRALETCATVDEFEALLRETASGPGRENPANLGVIDARAGAAIFEVGSRHHHRFDAGDPADAAGGFLVRANFSLSHDTTNIDTWRFRRARALVTKAAAHDGVDPLDLRETARDLCSRDVDPYPLPCECYPPGHPSALGYVDTDETINRVTSVSSGLIHGVRPGEDPRLSTLFLALGQPVITPFVPLWVAAGPTPREMDGEETAAFCDVAQRHRAEVYDHPWYWVFCNTRELADPLASQPRHLLLVRSIERRAHASVDALLEKWRLTGIDPAAMAAAEASLAGRMFAEYSGAGSSGNESRAMEVTPNPVRGRALILGHRRGPIEIFDVSGRLVARLEGSGERAVWDGRDQDGRTVGSGTYFCRPFGDPGPATSIIVLR